MTEYHRERWLTPFDICDTVECRARQITESRLRGKELAKRRPALTLRLGADDDFLVEIKPKLASSPTGWTIKAIEARLARRDDGKTEINTCLMPGVVKLTRWKADDDRTQAALELLTETLERFGADPAAAVASNAAHCAFCGRALSDPESRDWGIGPECRKDFVSAIREAELAMEVRP